MGEPYHCYMMWLLWNNKTLIMHYTSGVPLKLWYMCQWWYMKNSKAVHHMTSEHLLHIQEY